MSTEIIIPDTLPRNGMSVAELSRRTGVSTSSITRWTSEPRAVYLARADKKRRKIKELRAKGWAMQKIADEIGCSRGLVHRYVHEKELT